MNPKLLNLKVYAEQLQHRLKSPVPPKHAGRKEAYIQMLQIDLNKTLMKIEELSK